MSDRVNAENEQQALQLLHVIASSSSDAIFAKDEHGRYLLINEAAARFMGQPSRNFLGRDDRSVFPPEQAAQIMSNDRQVFESGRTETIEEAVQTPLGERVFFATKSPLRDAQGQIIGTFGISRDVTERKKLNEALRQSEARYRELFEANPHPMWVYDIETLAFLAVNDAAVHRYGYSHDEFLRMTIKDIRPPEDVGPLLENIAHLSGGLDDAGTWRHLTKDGRLMEVDITSHALIFDGRHAELVLAHDVTRRNSAERTLRASAAQLKQAQKMAQIGNWTLELTNGELHWSDEIFRIFEIDSAQFGASYELFLACVHPDERDEVDSAYWSSLETREPYAITHRLLFPDGRIKHVQEHCETDYGPDGRALRSRGTVQDITAHVLTEQALRDSEQRFRDLADNSADWIWTIDLNGFHTYSSPSTVAILGYRTEEFLKLDASTLVHPDDLGLFGNTFSQARAQKTGWRNVVIRWQHRDGSFRTMESSATPVLDSRGQLTGFQGVDRDITDRVQAQKALREGEERLRLALAAASQGLYDLDLTTGDAKVSPEYATMLGHDPTTFLETNAAWRDRMHPDDQPAVYRAYQDYVAGRLPEYRVEFRQRTRDGGWKWILSLGRIQERAADGRPLRMMGTHTDIDAIKAAEAALWELNASLEARVAERTAELTAANHELETFAYAVSHDLRAPLRAMSGFSSALMEDHAASLPSEARAYLEQIVLAGRKMSDLVEGLLTLSRSTRGDLRMDRVDVSALAETHLAELAAAEPARRVLVEVEDGLAVRGDERMLSSVLSNLLDNAWKYTGATPQSKISVRACEVDGQHGFCVSDNGAGFDMAHSARLFKAFQRLHRQDEFPGIGIGLATVQRIVQRHRGAITAHGVPGQGATFSVVLPGTTG
ncbi:MAG: PAS domain S-box protein [Hydrogenophaga sp.]|uniref:PAS domain S-box protein n=1 Tax=Hydrogenophaga sp. TaxID=1904254 RepID=UPI002732C495|nr:PAS domain S-box protein [Hydrogenophaga sp.]MDP3626438.1 PAS domain S-box protein [Hydrogenophaga sp.]